MTLNSRYLVVNGWTKDDIENLRLMLWRHAIIAEEYYGPQVCSENLEYSTHAADDIYRHSSPDNYCCDVYERTVDTWKQQKHNSKSVEATYGERDTIKAFIHDYEAKHGKLSTPAQVTCKFDYNSVRGRQFFLNETSFAAAEKVLAELEDIEGDPFADQAKRFGVLLGRLRRKGLSDVQHRDICRSISGNARIPRRARFTTALALKNSNNQIQRFAKGDSCLVGGTGQYAGELFHFVIDCFILVSIQGSYKIFVDGQFLIPIFNNGVLVTNTWTDTVVLRKRDYNRDRLQWSSQIVRKIILYPLTPDGNGNQDYIPIDFEAQPQNLPVHVPFYPLVDDDVAVKGPNGATWFAKVLNKDRDNKTARVKWYREVRPGQLRVTTQIDDIGYATILHKVNLHRGRYGFEIVTV